jgi:hypothetical protein
MNKEKTEATWLGSSRYNQSTPLGISWTKDPMRCLGVWLGYNEDKSNELNFENRIQKCKKIVNNWKQRNLSFLGKTLIIQTFIISQFLYACGAIDIPDKYIIEIENLIFDYFWSGGKPKLRRTMLKQKLEEGGVDMPDIKCMLKVNKIQWMKRYMFPEDHVWKK